MFFINSKEYDYKNLYSIPMAKELSANEKLFFKNENDRKELIFYGQKINEINNQKETDYSF